MSRTQHHGKMFRKTLRWGHFERKRDRNSGFLSKSQITERINMNEVSTDITSCDNQDIFEQAVTEYRRHIDNPGIVTM